MKLRSILVLALALVCAPAMAQVNPGTSPLSGAKGGTNNAFMQFSGPVSSLKTFSLPNSSDTIATLAAVRTWTGAQSFTDGTMILLGSGSGSSTLHAPANSGGNVTFFIGSDTVVGRSTTDTLANKTINCAGNTCTVRLGSDITGQLPIANGGTGQGTQQAGFNALAPTPTRAGDILYWNGSNYVSFPGNNSGTQAFTENASGVPAWATISGTGTVTSVTCGTGLSGGTFTTSGTCALALTNATLQANPGNPTGTGNVTGLMMGLGTTCHITPVYGTRVRLDFQGSMEGTASLASTTLQVRFGTGTAPANATAITGTAVGSQILGSNITGTNWTIPFAAGGIITGLTPATAYWFDFSLAASTGTASAVGIACSAMEF